MKPLLNISRLLLALACPLTASESGPNILPDKDTGALSTRWTPVVNLSDEFDGTALDRSKWHT